MGYSTATVVEEDESASKGVEVEVEVCRLIEERSGARGILC